MRKVWRLTLILVVLVLSAFICSSCEDGNYITNIELGKFPDNIVYYANESSELDLSGATVIVKVKSGDDQEYPVNYRYHWTIEDNVNFEIPGVYEVQVTWKGSVVARIPVQVISR